jgi:methylated-DNA-[protein]-cysteine S-methyltransferase
MQEFYHTYYDSPIGLIKIGGTEDYVGEIQFVDAANQMDYGLPGVSDILHQCTEQLIEYFQGRRKVFDIPISQNGTDYQLRVWSKLMEIPFGKTLSYLELAKRMGDPKATRAVASTNAKNNIAIIVPCHRVIGTDKSLVGYVGGMHRKKWLLQHEFRQLHGIQTLF